MKLDVARADDWTQAVDTVVRGFGGLDVLVNNAGTVRRASLVATSDDDYDRLVSIIQTGVFLGMRTALPLMVGAGTGFIVNVASVAGFQVSENRAIYSATKHAVVGMTKAAALENARRRREGQRGLPRSHEDADDLGKRGVVYHGDWKPNRDATNRRVCGSR